MTTVKTKIISLEKQLLPTGRSFRASDGSDQEHLLKAMAESHAQLYDDAVAIFSSMIPDNNDFTVDDASDWERRLGMAQSTASLSDRKLAILRKMAAPGRNPAKGHYLHIQQQLQDAGFNVYVRENIFPTYPGVHYTTFDPYALNSLIFTLIQFNEDVGGQIVQFGDFQFNGLLNDIVANSLDNGIDVRFDTGENLRSTFFIGGTPLGTYANVPTVRMSEFRQLILNLKQVQNVAILFINYT